VRARRLCICVFVYLCICVFLNVNTRDKQATVSCMSEILKMFTEILKFRISVNTRDSEIAQVNTRPSGIVHVNIRNIYVNIRKISTCHKENRAETRE